jgi:hypothetical protein
LGNSLLKGITHLKCSFKNSIISIVCREKTHILCEKIMTLAGKIGSDSSRVFTSRWGGEKINRDEHTGDMESIEKEERLIIQLRL